MACTSPFALHRFSSMGCASARLLEHASNAAVATHAATMRTNWSELGIWYGSGRGRCPEPNRRASFVIGFKRLGRRMSLPWRARVLLQASPLATRQGLETRVSQGRTSVGPALPCRLHLGVGPWLGPPQRTDRLRRGDHLERSPTGE